MQRKFLEEMGVEKDLIDKIMAENGHDVENARNSEANKFNAERSNMQNRVNDLQGQIDQRDADIKSIKDKLTEAQKDAGKLTDVNNQLTSLQAKYDADRAEWSKKQQEQAYEFAVKTATNGLKFTSSAAKREFERGAIEKALKMDGDKILGFDDYVKSYRESDPGAFVVDEPNPGILTPAPTIVLPTGTPKPEASAFGFNFHGVRPAPKE